MPVPPRSRCSLTGPEVALSSDSDSSFGTCSCTEAVADRADGVCPSRGHFKFDETSGTCWSAHDVLGDAAASYSLFLSRSKVSANAYGRGDQLSPARHTGPFMVWPNMADYRSEKPYIWPSTVLYGRAARGMNSDDESVHDIW